MSRIIGRALTMYGIQQSPLICSRSCNSKASSEAFDEKVLQYLACPTSKQKLRYDSMTNVLICDHLQVAYPIVNGIPNLIPSSAKPLAQIKSEEEQTVKSRTTHD